MQPWERALSKFIERYKKEEYVEGFLLCGSYACGNQNIDSDIDIHIITNDEQDWRERGNTRIDGFLIEYFINPAQQMRDYLEKNYQNNITTTANMFAYGTILYDKNGYMAKLKEEALSYLAKELKPISNTANQNTLYHLWDAYDELCVLYKNNQQTALSYNLLLSQLVTAYYAYHRLPQVPFSKIERILTNSDFQKKYHIDKMPTQQFIDLFLTSLKEQNFTTITNFYTFVINECGGFDINQFMLRSPIKIENKTTL